MSTAFERRQARLVGYQAHDQITKNTASRLTQWKVLIHRRSWRRAATVLTDRFSASRSIAEPDSVCTQTYLVAGPFEIREAGRERRDAIYRRGSFASWFRLRKITQHATRERLYAWFPSRRGIQAWTDEDSLREIRHHQRARSLTSSRRSEHDERRRRATMSKTIEEILAPKPEARPRIYAYSIDDKAHAGLLKVGQTTRDVKQRVAEQLKTANIKNYTIELDEFAERDDGTTFTDHEVRAALARKGCENAELEWMRCTLKDVKTVLTELRTGQRFTGTHDRDLRHARRAARGRGKDPRLFPLHLEGGYARRPALPVEREDALRQDLHHAISSPRNSGPSACSWSPSSPPWRMRGRRTSNPTWTSTAGNTSRAIPAAIRRRSPPSKPLVYFGSFQDLLGRDDAGNIKPKNEWLHKVKWDLVVFDEYHFGAWRETAKELFEGEEEAVAKKEAKLEYAAGLEDVNEDLTRTLGEGDRVPAHHHQGLPLSLRHAVQGAGHGRVHRGADFQLDLHRRAARQGRVRAEESRQVESLRRAAADAAAHLSDAGRVGGDRERRGV